MPAALKPPMRIHSPLRLAACAVCAMVLHACRPDGGLTEPTATGSRSLTVCAPVPPTPLSELPRGAALDEEHAARWYPPVLAARAAIPDELAHWPLNGNLEDSNGLYPLAANAPQFAPASFVDAAATALAAGEGASSASLSAVPTGNGVTISGWVAVSAASDGVLFGFGDGSPGGANLHVAAVAGALVARLGDPAAGGVVVPLGPVRDGCFHHIAIVVPPSAKVSAVTMRLDGMVVGSMDGALPIFPDAALMGRAFRVGSASSGLIDDVRVHARALSEAELAVFASPTGSGPRCAPVASPTFTPGARCVASALRPGIDMTVRVLADDTLAVIHDPTSWLRARFADGCGPLLGGLAANAARFAGLSVSKEYTLAAAETVAALRPPLLQAIQSPTHLVFGSCSTASTAPAWQSVWPMGISELDVPLIAKPGEFSTVQARVAYAAYVRLPFRMKPGQSYYVRDVWGNATTFSYAADTVSWAMAINQIGHAPDAPAKLGYIGAWLGPGHALDVARYAGKPFTLVDDTTSKVVFAGTASAVLGDEKWRGTPVRGAPTVRLDFSAVTAPGRYRLIAPGVGSSRPFTIGDDAVGEIFYVHARGLYHARCSGLPPATTPWSRGDAHTARVGGFPPEDADFKDHAAEGWGFRDASGRYAPHTVFDAVSRTMTTTPLPEVTGGWHDAADFDRNPKHLDAAADLARAYLLFPQNFVDAQLDVPESGNGIPDLLDEAAFGLSVFRAAQRADGGVPTRVEARRHPTTWDPALDADVHYVSLATRTSSLRYAAAAATLARALAVAGAAAPSAAWLDSATRAYRYGVSAKRVATSFAVGTATHSWTESPDPDPAQRLHAATALSLATGDPAYRNDLSGAAMETAFQAELLAYQDQGAPLAMADLALAAPSAVPPGWTVTAQAKVLGAASAWLAWQEAEPYHKLWYPPTHSLFWTLGWGNDGYAPARHLVAAYRLSGDPSFKRGALLAVDWMLGANPQGKSQTTGLGPFGPVSVLHLPSLVDQRAEPVPGITPFGYVEGTVATTAATRVYGIFDAAVPSYGFTGTALVQLPSTIAGSATSPAQILAKLSTAWPLWHRQTTLEHQNPPITEFTVHETIAPAAVVTGCLLPPGWKPSTAVRARTPRSTDEVEDARRGLPLPASSPRRVAAKE